MKTDNDFLLKQHRAQDVRFCTASTLNLRIRFENYSNRDHLIDELRKIISWFPLMLDLNISVHLQGTYGHEFNEGLSFLLTDLQNIRFGASKKVPAVYLFSSVSCNKESFLRLLNQYNTIDDFIHLVSVIEEDSLNTELLEERIHEYKIIADSLFLNNQALFSIDFFNSYTAMMEFVKRIKGKYFYNGFIYWIYLKNTSMNNKNNYKQLLDIFNLPKFSLNYTHHLPSGLLDILFCAEKVLCDQGRDTKDYETLLNRLVAANDLFRHNCYCFNNETLFFERESSGADIDLMAFLVENIPAIRDVKVQDKTWVKVRSAMADFVNKEIC